MAISITRPIYIFCVKSKYSFECQRESISGLVLVLYHYSLYTILILIIVVVKCSFKIIRTKQRKDERER